MSTPLIMFLVFIAITLAITYWAAKRSSGASAYFAAGRRIKGWQNGIAVAGDYMSAASFLGIAGIIAFQGYDGFLYSVGWLVAYLTVLLVFAVASSANLPVILLSIFWKRFTTQGAVWGIATGLAGSLALIVISPSIMGIDGPAVAKAARHLIQAKPLFPLENPGILSIPLGFLGAFVGTLMSRRDDAAEHKFTELEVRANTGLGSETAIAR
jgi:Na+(H+)/acetate symporter ActP